MNMHFQTFRLQPPYVPPSGDALLLRTRLGHRLALHCYRQNFGLRSLVAVSSVTKGRIEFVSRPTFGSQFYGLSVHFQLLSTSCRHDAVTFSYWREAPPERDFHSPVHAHSQAHDRDRHGRASRRLADRFTAHNHEPNRFQRGSLRRDAEDSGRGPGGRPRCAPLPTAPFRSRPKSINPRLSKQTEFGGAPNLTGPSPLPPIPNHPSACLTRLNASRAFFPGGTGVPPVDLGVSPKSAGFGETPKIAGEVLADGHDALRNPLPRSGSATGRQGRHVQL